jgi:biotin--protein ligase
MAAKRMNVLVYSGGLAKTAWWANENLMTSPGNGSTVESVRHCLYTLRRLLAPNYAVIPVTGDMLIKEPWTATCAALVFPGGADQGYCGTLNGDGNRRIRQFVERGGVYIGFCAGGYYGCRRCEFEVGNKLLEVIGDRELAFFPGPCRGCAFPGFVYHSEKGARAAELKVDSTALSTGLVLNTFKAYYNGGGVFADALRFRDQGVEVLASYTEEIAVDGGDGSAAVVYCKVGQGAALLTGPHPEFVFFGKPADNCSLTKPRYATATLEKGKADTPEFAQVVDILAGDEKHRIDFLKACLLKLGLTVNEDSQGVPSLSLIHLSALETATSTKLLETLERDGLMFTEDGEQYLKDDNDKFHFVKHSSWIMNNLQDALPSTTTSKASQSMTANQSEHSSRQAASPSVTSSSTHAQVASSAPTGTTTDSIIDYNTVTKQILVHTSPAHPSNKETPYFNHSTFFSHLTSCDTDGASAFSPGIPHPGPRSRFGNPLIYGEVVTSTNTLLEKNTHLLRRLQTGTTFTATTQFTGRGRGSNIWVSPRGSLMFSTVIRHPMALMSRAPVVFVQYLAAMAVVEGVKTYDSADGTRSTGSTTTTTTSRRSLYANMPIKLKWPNDIYALSPGRSDTSNPDAYTKIGGILVNSHYNAESYIAVCGVGLNVANSAPTTSLNALLASSAPPGSKPNPPPPFTLERLLARILICFEALYTRFLDTGFDGYFEDLYYKDWLHMDQVVTLETQGGARARIKGITRDYGLLVAEELGWEDRATGRRWELQSDSNSFDFVSAPFPFHVWAFKCAGPNAVLLPDIVLAD